MAEEARLAEVESGLVPASEGWFVVNVRDAAWIVNEAFGARCRFEADPRNVRGHPDLEARHFDQIGYTLIVAEPGKPTTMYHAESDQEDFLVLAGDCLLIVEGDERPLKAWDFFHCAPGTAHAFVGTGDGPCVIFAVGARTEDGTIVYGRNETALSRGAGVETETNSPHEAYARFPHWERGRPGTWKDLPWA